MTIDHLKKSAVWERNKHLFDEKPGKQKKAAGTKIGGKIVSKVYYQASREKMSIETTLFDFCQSRVITLFSEYRFCEERAWRLDWYFECQEKRYGVEYNGIMSSKSRHTTITGYSGDMDKINAAQQAGIIVLQYTPLNYSNLSIDLEKIL